MYSENSEGKKRIEEKAKVWDGEVTAIVKGSDTALSLFCGFFTRTSWRIATMRNRKLMCGLMYVADHEER